MRVHRESRAIILPLYPPFFEEQFQGKSKSEVDFEKWYTDSLDVHLRSPITSNWIKRCRAYHNDKFDGYGQLCHYLCPQLPGARVNAKVDTVVLKFQDYEDDNFLSLLYPFAAMEDKAKIRHLAIDLYLWDYLVETDADNYGFKDVLTEYTNFESLCIFGSPKTPLLDSDTPEWSSLLGYKWMEIYLRIEIRKCLSQLLERGENIDVTVEKDWESLVADIWKQEGSLDKEESNH
jgi:hypothetical protein